MKRSIYIGWDPREAAAFAVARYSLVRHLSQPIDVNGLVLEDLQDRWLYTRPLERMKFPRGVMWDTISDAPMSTEHANARFLTPHLAKTGWAMFMDGDILARGDVADLFDGLDPRKAVYCVQHDHDALPGVKMDGQIQTAYVRKNWSSVMVFNCDHPANAALTLDLVNTAPGRDLHRFCWLEDKDIGALNPRWNYLVGHSSADVEPRLVHFTDGVPDMPGFENVEFADAWRAERRRWAA